MHRSFRRAASALVAALLLLTIAPGCGLVGSDDPLPTAAFEVGCTTIQDSLVQFSNLSLHASSYSWSFGDGRSSTEQSPSILYSRAGLYDVTLVARSEEGEVDSVRQRVRIHPHIPDRVFLDLDDVRALYDSYSWAALTESVLRHFGEFVRQCEIVSIYTRGDCCSSDAGCAAWLGPDVIAGALRHHASVVATVKPGPMSAEALRAELAQERPVIAWYNAANTFYVVAIIGYNEQGDFFTLDPFYGHELVEYEDLLRYRYTNELMEWQTTIHCMRRPG